MDSAQQQKRRLADQLEKETGDMRTSRPMNDIERLEKECEYLRRKIREQDVELLNVYRVMHSLKYGGALQGETSDRPY